MKPKLIPALTTLSAAAVACVFSFIEGVSFGLFVKRVAIAAIVFFILGMIIRIIIEWNFKPEEPEEPEEETSEGEEGEELEEEKDEPVA